MRPLNAAAYGEVLSVSCSVGYLTAATADSAPSADGSAISHALPSKQFDLKSLAMICPLRSGWLSYRPDRQELVMGSMLPIPGGVLKN